MKERIFDIAYEIAWKHVFQNEDFFVAISVNDKIIDVSRNTAMKLERQNKLPAIYCEFRFEAKNFRTTIQQQVAQLVGSYLSHKQVLQLNQYRKLLQDNDDFIHYDIPTLLYQYCQEHFEVQYEWYLGDEIDKMLVDCKKSIQYQRLLEYDTCARNFIFTR